MKEKFGMMRAVADAAISEARREDALDVMLFILKEDGTETQDAGLPDLDRHDKRFHHGHFDEKTMHCSLRERLAQSDSPDADVERHERVMSGLSNRKLDEYVDLLGRKRPDLDAEEVLETIAGIEDRKIQGDAFRWLMKGKIRLPEDLYKVREARALADRAKRDPLSFETPQACINELSESDSLPFGEQTGKINPDTVKELSDRRELPMGVTTYRVRDDERGQRAMRKIIDSHWGEDANPWCLLARHDEDVADGDRHLRTAWHFWNDVYNAKPKRVAFKDGNLLAFMATEGDGLKDDRLHYRLLAHPEIRDNWDESKGSVFDFARKNYPQIWEEANEAVTPDEWWDRNDDSHMGIPIGIIPMPGGGKDQMCDGEIVNGKIEGFPLTRKGTKGKSGYSEWNGDGYLSYRITKTNQDGDITGFWKFDDEGNLREYSDDTFAFARDDSNYLKNGPFLHLYGKNEDGTTNKDESVTVNGDGKVVEVMKGDYSLSVKDDGRFVFDEGDYAFIFGKDGKMEKIRAYDDEGDVYCVSPSERPKSIRDADEIRWFERYRDDMTAEAQKIPQILRQAHQDYLRAIDTMYKRGQGEQRDVLRRLPYAWQSDWDRMKAGNTARLVDFLGKRD